MQTTASNPKIGTELARPADAAPTVAAAFVHKRYRQALELSLSFKLTAVVLVTAVVALALLIQ